MNMKNEENVKYFKWGLMGMGLITFGLLLFFILYNADGLTGMFNFILGILRPFVYGCVIAYLVVPLCRRFEKIFGKIMGEKRKAMAASLSNVLAIVIAVILVLAVVFLIVPQLVYSVTGILNALPGQVEAANAKITEMVKDNPELQQEWDSIYAMVEKTITDFLGTGDNKDPAAMLEKLLPLVNGAAYHVAGLMSIVKDLFLGVIIALYILSKRAQLGAQATLILKGIVKSEWTDWILKEVHFADRMFNGFFMGKLMDSAIVGVICFVFCAIVKFESPLLIAVIVGVTNIIPFFGPFIGAIPCALLLLLENPAHCLIFLVFVVILQQVDGNIIGPKILGNTTGLSGLWVMFAILLFGGLWGIIGLLIGVPLMAVIYDVIRQITYKGLRRKGKEEMIATYNESFHPEGKA